jgi:hypothetical protein
MLIGYLDQLILDALPSLLYYHWNLNITHLDIHCLVQAAEALGRTSVPTPDTMFHRIHFLTICFSKPA